ncbi:hypothetical protein ACPA9J_15165 [Pseudomonas aeruginosa]
MKLNDTLLVGGAKSDSVTGTYLIEAGAQIRLGLRQERVGVQRRRHHQYLRRAFNLHARRQRQHRHWRPPRPQSRRRQRGSTPRRGVRRHRAGTGDVSPPPAKG